MSDDLFQIKVNEISKKYVRKLYPIGVVNFILGNTLILIFMLLAANNILRHDYSGDNTFKEIFFSLFPVYTVIYSILGVIGNFYFFNFIRKLKQGIAHTDERSYNLSFKYIYINTILYVIATVIGLIFMVIDIWLLL